MVGWIQKCYSSRAATLYPSPHLFFAHHPDDPPPILNRPLPIQPHNITAYTPQIFPAGVEQLPPTIWSRGRQCDIEMPHREQDRSAHDRWNLIKRIHWGLKPALP